MIRGGLMHLEPKVKIDYLVIHAKLLLINVNHVDIYIYIYYRKFINTKNWTKLFIFVDVAD